MQQDKTERLLNLLKWLIQEYEDGDGTIPDGLYNAAIIATKNKG